MSSVKDIALFISEEDDYCTRPAGAQDSDDKDSGTQALYTVDDIEEGLQQFERQRHIDVPEQPKFSGGNGSMEPISILEMVTKNESAVEEKLGAPPNGTDRLYTIEDILEVLEMEDGHLSLKDEQEKYVDLRTEEPKETAKMMRDRCRRRMREEERRIRKQTWRKYSLDSLNSNSDKMSTGLSGQKQERVDRTDDKERLSERLSQLGGDKQEQMTGTEVKKLDLVPNAEKNGDGNAFLSRGPVEKTVATPVHDSVGNFSESPLSATQPLVDDKVSAAQSSQDVVIGDGFDKKSSTSTVSLPEIQNVIPEETKSRFHCPLTEKTRRMVGNQRPRSSGCGIAGIQVRSEYPRLECETKHVHGNGIKPPACKEVKSSPESSDYRQPMDGVSCKEETVTDSQNRLRSEEVDRSAHEQNMGKVNLNAGGKVRRFFSGFTIACRLLCCVSDTSSSEE
ncbi:PREDICTED: uncharacterized protein LOC109465958 [Branchiostoma belcheri]|uniref:Uncharacterized protein LOC109465958 n=1 Tax=Branchiostoma belcheri TaxID=7741 RepID=A0A6P4YP87_BRABE|nr:PREDICTED: uncharacterized protein LOC109465958 [Branchiostoma belcheri]